jgi:hypothetical protein
MDNKYKHPNPDVFSGVYAFGLLSDQQLLETDTISSLPYSQNADGTQKRLKDHCTTVFSKLDGTECIVCLNGKQNEHGRATPVLWEEVEAWIPYIENDLGGSILGYDEYRNLIAQWQANGEI